jgi:hypothetical protein
LSSSIHAGSERQTLACIDHYEVTYPEILRSRFEVGVINFEAVKDEDEFQVSVRLPAYVCQYVVNLMFPVGGNDRRH